MRFVKNFAVFVVALRQRSKTIVPTRKFAAYTSVTLTGSAAWGLSLFGANKTINVADFMAEPVTPVAILEKQEDMKSRFELFVLGVQKDFCHQVEIIEDDFELRGIRVENDASRKSGRFKVDRWIRSEGGGGITCIMEDGQVFERAGVNISVVKGILPPAAVQEMKARGHDFTIPAGQKGLPFFASGVSCVIHPRNPHVPTIHFNYRYFEVEEKTDNPDKPKVTWWFGGGTDLTPYVLDEDDCRHFHKSLKTACDAHDKTYYPRFKKWCDNYFFNKHRNECRGVGGIFFDDLDEKGQEKTFSFVKQCAAAAIPCYIPLVKKNYDKAYGYDERQWQLLRRGRYVEFNLVYDRGTKFGLLTPGARIESILMSLPREAKWKYSYTPVAGSNEAKLTDILREPKEWV